MAKIGTTGEIRFNVRISTSLHEGLVRRAKANGRSMNSEVIAILEDAIETTDEAQIRRIQSDISIVEAALRESQHVTSTLQDRKSVMQDELRRMQAFMAANRAQEKMSGR